MSLYNFDIIAGASHCISTTVKDSDGNPLDISAYDTIRGGAKVNFSSNSYILNLNPTITVPSSGLININVSGYATSGLPCSIYPYDIEIAQTSISGDGRVMKILRGYISLSPEVSNF